ncbi:MAG: nucleotidyltransferase domain-containing protein, partial [Ectothiorhodospira sp.]
MPPDPVSTLPPLPGSLAQHLDWPAREADLMTLPGPDRAAFVQVLERVRAALRSAFEAGCPVEDLVRGRSAVMDRLLVAAWKALELDTLPDLGLAAVGGYGRGELHPGSDIDILILYREGPLPTRAEEALVGLLTFLWDIGLEVGHSVRSLTDCTREAERDITVATNLLEYRPLAGPRALFEDLGAHIAPERMWNSRAFFAAKLDEQEARHHRFGETAYRLEPNLKESPGGLRDIQMIAWVTRRHFGSGDLEELVDHGFLTGNECRDLMEGRDFLWRVRFALHLLAGRK